MHWAWEVCLKTQHHGWRRMKILQEIIPSTCYVYAGRLKMAWDVKNWDQKSKKASRTKQLTDVLYFHESKMVHGK